MISPKSIKTLIHFFEKWSQTPQETKSLPSPQRRRENPIFSEKYMTLAVYGTIYHLPIIQKEELSMSDIRH